ncbi:hypothetical protein KY363_02230 [Candidatus Woesearchaeota archaeon]|nr:hypothetical protein [Candidatus Woesearchaeota archaeon]
MDAGQTYQEQHKDIEGITSSYFDRKQPDEGRYGLTQVLAKEIQAEIQPPLQSITYSLADGLSDAVNKYSAEQAYPSFWEATRHFDTAFYTRELVKKRRGNIAMFTRDCLDPEKDNRRQAYRKIGELGLWDMVKGYRPEDPAPKPLTTTAKSYISPERISTSLTSSLSTYKDTLHPKLYNDISSRIAERSETIAERISQYIPTPATRLGRIMEKTEGLTRYNEARSVFEKNIIYDAFKAAGWDRKKAEKYLQLDSRTLKSKMETLGLDEESMKKGIEQANVILTDPQQTEPARPPSEVDRLRQLQEEYAKRWEAERQRKETSCRKKTTRAAA